MISILILTYNEEINLPACLESVKWSNDVVVLDSFSQDGTVDLAKKYKARVIQREFDNYASQRNYGLNKIDYENSWVLMVDADERVPEKMDKEINEAIEENDNKNICLYRFRRKDFFMGRWLKRSSGYPTWFGRLAKVGHVRVQRAINEEYITDGKVGYLNSHIHHYPFNKGISAWIEKHNRYSSMEAELLSKDGLQKPNLSDYFNSDPAVRRSAIKWLIYKMPGRPLLIFMALYFARLGFLDGRAGLTFCILRTYYEFLISIKVKEIQRRKKGLPV